MKCEYPFNCGDCIHYDWKKHRCIGMEIVENGKCVLCGKPLEKDRLFICRECQKKENDLCENRRYAIPKKY